MKYCSPRCRSIARKFMAYRELVMDEENQPILRHLEKMANE